MALDAVDRTGLCLGRCFNKYDILLPGAVHTHICASLSQGRLNHKRQIETSSQEHAILVSYTNTRL